MKKLYPTPHINACPEDFASTVIMPGDPLRSKFIAENYLEGARLINNVRGIQGYTGKYDGVRISVMASGMGMPSIGIYSYELYNFFGVENIIRAGSAGGMSEKVALRDIVLGMGASTNGNFAHQYGLPGNYSAVCSYKLLKRCAETAENMKLSYIVGQILSSDTFYNDEDDLPESRRTTALWSKMGILAVEMEAAALYMNAARSGKNALAVCTVSDHLLTGEATSAEERQNSFTDMIELCLKTAVSIEMETKNEK